MLRNPRVLLLALPLLLAVAGPAHAMRCKGKIISTGDPQAKVRHYCGSPAAARERVIYRSGIPYGQLRAAPADSDTPAGRHPQELAVHDRSVVEVLVEEWTYNLGPHRLMRVVRFEDGLVVDVQRLGYGFHE